MSVLVDCSCSLDTLPVLLKTEHSPPKQLVYCCRKNVRGVKKVTGTPYVLCMLMDLMQS